MAYTRAQTSRGNAAAAIAVSVGAGQLWVAPTANNTLIAVAFSNAAVASTFTIPGFVTVISQSNVASVTVAILMKAIADGSESTITCTASNGTATDLVCMEVNSGSASSLLDQVLANVVATGTSQVCGPTAALAGAGELGIVGVGISNAVTAPGFTNAYTLEVATTHLIVGSNLNVGAAATSSTVSWTTSRPHAGVIAALKGAALPLYAGWGVPH